MISNLLMATGSQAPISTVDIVDPFGDGSGVALYKFDGDATDVSGNYNGVASDVTYSTGQFGQCIKPNSSSSVFSLGVINFNTPVTVSFWSKGSNLISNGRNSAAYGTFMFHEHAFYMFSTNTAYASTAYAITDIPYEPLMWKHYSFVINYPSVKVYIDGILVKAGTMSSSVGTSNYSLGFWNIDNWNRAITSDSAIDQFRIFNRAITAEEVTALYEESVDSYTPYVHPPQPIGIIPEANLVAFYPLDTDARDDFSTYEGTASSVTFDGTKAVFNGSSSYISIPAITVGSEFISFSFWIQFNNSGEHLFFDTQLWNSSNGYGFYKKTSNQLVVNFKQSGFSSYVVSTASVPIGQVIHLVVVKNAGTCTLYIDGAVFHTSSITNFTAIPAQTGMIGRQYSPAVAYLNGSISRVAIFNKAITAEEVTALYNEGQS